MFTIPFQLTEAMHRDMYPPVDPENANVKVAGAGKVALITGASGGLGYQIAQAWSTATAAGIILVGRSAEKLQALADSLNSRTLVASANIASAAEVEALYGQAIAEFGKIDVLINTAGISDFNAPIKTSAPAVWWEAFESNVLGFYNMAHYFVRTTDGHGTIINLVSLGASFLVGGMSGYSSAKLAATKLAEYLSLEHPKLRVFSVHPGIVEAEAGRGTVADHFVPFAKDKSALTAGVTLYLQKHDADHLRGGFLSVNWDVEEMEKHKDEIQEKELLKLGFIKGQLGPEGHPWGA